MIPVVSNRRHTVVFQFAQSKYGSLYGEPHDAIRIHKHFFGEEICLARTHAEPHVTTMKDLGLGRYFD